MAIRVVKAGDAQRAICFLLAFVAYAVRLYRSYSDALARTTFRYSIVYLAALFGALLVDHYAAPLF